METVERNKTMVRDFYEEVMNNHDVSGLGAYCSDDFIDHNPDPGHSGKGLNDIKAMLNEMFIAFPDLSATTEFMVAEKDMVVVYLTMKGTNTGSFSGMPPTNKSIKINGIDIIRIKEGKAVERWGVFQDLLTLSQLGFANPTKASELAG